MSRGQRISFKARPRCKVRRLTDDSALLRLSRSDQVADNDQPRRNADPGLEGSIWFERTDSTNQLKSGPNRSLGVVLMGLRIAEVNEYAVAHVLRHEPAETLHSLGNTPLIAGNDLA